MSRPDPPPSPAGPPRLSAPLIRRRLLVVAALLPLAALLALTWWQGRDIRLFDNLTPSQISRIHIQRQADGKPSAPLVLERHPQGWRIASAADAPADADRIEHLLRQLTALSGQPAGPPVAGQPAQLEVRLFDRQGRQAGGVAFSATTAARLPGGPAIAIAAPPALPDWASGWTILHPPAIAIDQVVAVEPLAAGGAAAGRGAPPPLPPAAVGQTVALLLSLRVQDFAAARDIDWSGSRHLRVRLRDGATFDLEQVPDGAGRYFLRLTSDRLPSIGATARYAFRVEQPLPPPAG